MEPQEQEREKLSFAYSDDGVDVSLIRWMLSLTPAERLQVLQRFVNSVLEVRERNKVVRSGVALPLQPVTEPRQLWSGF